MKFLEIRQAILVVFSLLLFSMTGLVSAQNAPEVIAVGENKSAEINDTNSTQLYTLNIATPQAIQIQALGLTTGFAPAVQVTDPNGIIVKEILNMSGETIISGSTTLNKTGDYTVSVYSANGTQGQFVISIQPVALPVPIQLTAGQAVSNTTNTTTPIQLYEFAASTTDVLLLTVKSDAPTAGSIVIISDKATDAILGQGSFELIGIRFRLPLGFTDYQVRVTHSGQLPDEAYTVCLETETRVEAGETRCGEPAEVAASPTPPPASNICTASATAQSVNVRRGPSTSYEAFGTLTSTMKAGVVGRLSDQSWYQINYNGQYGWVSAGFVTLEGDCGNIPPVAPPPPPTAGPTNVPPMNTDAPTWTPAGPTLTPTTTFTPGPMPSATATFSATPLPPTSIFIPITIDSSLIQTALAPTSTFYFIPPIIVTLSP